MTSNTIIVMKKEDLPPCTGDNKDKFIILDVIFLLVLNILVVGGLIGITYLAFSDLINSLIGK